MIYIAEIEIFATGAKLVCKSNETAKPLFLFQERIIYRLDLDDWTEMNDDEIRQSRTLDQTSRWSWALSNKCLIPDYVYLIGSLAKCQNQILCRNYEAAITTMTEISSPKQAHYLVYSARSESNQAKAKVLWRKLRENDPTGKDDKNGNYSEVIRP